MTTSPCLELQLLSPRLDFLAYRRCHVHAIQHRVADAHVVRPLGDEIGDTHAILLAGALQPAFCLRPDDRLEVVVPVDHGTGCSLQSVQPGATSLVLNGEHLVARVVDERSFHLVTVAHATMDQQASFADGLLHAIETWSEPTPHDHLAAVFFERLEQDAHALILDWMQLDQLHLECAIVLLDTFELRHVAASYLLDAQ